MERETKELGEKMKTKEVTEKTIVCRYCGKVLVRYDQDSQPAEQWFYCQSCGLKTFYEPL